MRGGADFTAPPQSPSTNPEGNAEGAVTGGQHALQGFHERPRVSVSTTRHSSLPA
jgi:hypothetical protein